MPFAQEPQCGLDVRKHRHDLLWMVRRLLVYASIGKGFQGCCYLLALSGFY